MLLCAALLLCAAVFWGIHAYQVDTSASEGRDDLDIIGFLVILSVGATTAARKMLAPSAEAVLAHDPRPPVVYLRPFEEDERRFDMLPVGRRIGGRAVMQASHPESHERRIARVLRRIGPVVAVGAPGDSLAPLGAARLYLADDEWQKKVEELVRGAAAIVLVPETSEGTRWEVTEVARWVDPRRVLMIVPNPSLRPLGYARIQALTAATLPVPLPRYCENADAFMFDTTGRPQPIVLARGEKSALQPFFEQLQALSPAGVSPA
jgi:hypothetical protein